MDTIRFCSGNKHQILGSSSHTRGIYNCLTLNQMSEEQMREVAEKQNAVDKEEFLKLLRKHASAQRTQVTTS